MIYDGLVFILVCFDDDSTVKVFTTLELLNTYRDIHNIHDMDCFTSECKLIKELD
jgi:hypothetical protein